MPNWIRRPQLMVETHHELVYASLTHAGTEYRFTCNEKGEVDPAGQTEARQLALARCVAGLGTAYAQPRLVSREHSWFDSGAIRCHCGARHELERHDSTCDSCGQDYNGFGQELRPQSQWEEDY
jgi:hypothetical protein